MSTNGRMAFARLFSQRRANLDLSVVDVAVGTGRPMEVVVSWEQGSAVPSGDELARLAEVLALPKPLLEEALRRVTDYRREVATRAPPEPESKPESPDGVREEAPPEPTTASVLATMPDQPLTFSERLQDLSELASRRIAAALAGIRRSPSQQGTAGARTAYPSYLEDRNQMITYRLRAVFTTAGVVVLVLVLQWSLGVLGSAVADLWKTLISVL